MSSLQSKIISLYLKYVLSKQTCGLSLDQERKYLDDLGRKQKMPSNMNVTKIHVGGIPAESISGSGANAGRVIIYFHGGSYSLGSCQSHRFLVAHISKAAKIPVVLPEYRLAPEFPFPAAVEDALAVYQVILNSSNAKKIILVGDSVGGGLAVALAVVLKERNIALPAAIVCLSPVVDLGLTGESIYSKAKEDVILNPETFKKYIARYIGHTDTKHPLMSPIYADLTGLPPLLIQVGGKEILLCDSTRLADKARSSGVDVTLDIWPDMWHVWPYFVNYIPEGQVAINKIAAFIQRY